MVAAARGIKPKPHQQWFQEVLEEGNRMEPHILAQYKAATGCEFVDTQPEVEMDLGIINGNRVIIRGHMDGIVMNKYGDTRIVEAKKFRLSTYPNFVANAVNVNPYYPWQLSVYMIASNMPADFVGGRYDPDTDKITEITTYAYNTPPISLDEIRKKIVETEDFIRGGFAADEVPCVGSYPCGYYELHDEQTGKGNDAIALTLTPELDDLLNNWAELASMIKDEEAIVKSLQASKKVLSDELRAILSKEPVGGNKYAATTLNGASHVISWTRRPVPAKTTKAYELDYFTIKTDRTKK
jgi:hypothetical protein